MKHKLIAASIVLAIIIVSLLLVLFEDARIIFAICVLFFLSKIMLIAIYGTLNDN